jgi:uncharacterized protein YggT (Ycf19 family)
MVQVVTQPAVPTVEEFERRARAAETSPVPTFLRIGRFVVRALYVIAMAIVVLLMLTFVLRLFGASTDASFTRWVYRNADVAMQPFRGIFPTRVIGESSVLDVSVLVGALVYVVIAIGGDALFHALSTRLDRQQAEAAHARAQADSVRLHVEAQQFAAQQQAEQQHAAQQFAARQQAQQAQQAGHQQIPPPSGAATPPPWGPTGT